MERTRITACLLAVVVVLAGVPASGAATAGAATSVQSPDATATATQVNNTTTDSSTVNVTAGRQLSTVISATSDDVQSEVDATDFELEYENGSDEARAEAIAERSDRLRDRADAIRDDYEDATESYEAGELTKSEYAQRIATLNARAENVVAGYEQLSNRSANVSKLELRAAGLNETALQQSVDDLDSVRGSGAEALLQRFTGTSSGEVEIETDGGLSVEVSGEGGEFSREITRDRDGSTNLTVSQSAALETARGALSSPTNASWTLQKASIHEDSGYYKFEFGFETADRTGEAEVRVDGSSGEVFRIEEAVEPTDDETEERDDETEERDDEAEERDDETEERELALLVAGGTVAANETITVEALRDGEPAADVAVTMNGEPVGTTGADGTVSVTLPSSGDVELTAGEGELEFELRETEDEDDIYRNLNAATTLSNGTVTVTVTYEGSGIGNATVYANDAQVATTDSDGTATFAVPNGTEELDVEVVKGEFEAEFEYELRNGALTQTDGADDGEEANEEEATEDAEEEATEDAEEEATEDAEEEATEDAEEEATEDAEETEETEETEDEDEDEEETEDTDAEDDD